MRSWAWRMGAMRRCWRGGSGVASMGMTCADLRPLRRRVSERAGVQVRARASEVRRATVMVRARARKKVPVTPVTAMRGRKTTMGVMVRCV